MEKITSIICTQEDTNYLAFFREFQEKGIQGLEKERQEIYPLLNHFYESNPKVTHDLLDYINLIDGDKV